MGRLTYFFSSFLGWHFSQTLPPSAAFTQHSCLHFLPALTVALQHGSSSAARTKLTVANIAPAQRSALTIFRCFFTILPFSLWFADRPVRRPDTDDPRIPESPKEAESIWFGPPPAPIA